MPKPWRYFFRLSLLLALWLSLTACEEKPRQYEFMLQTVGGPEGWPVWVENLSFNNAWGGPAGGLSQGFDRRPPSPHSTVIFGTPLSAPQSMQARWFSHRTQTYYEIDLELPHTDALLRQWYRDYPSSKYGHNLIAGFSGKGEVYVWWHAGCFNCPDNSEDLHAPIVESAYGEEAEGDPIRYRNRTQEYIDEGTIPSP